MLGVAKFLWRIALPFVLCWESAGFSDGYSGYNRWSSGAHPIRLCWSNPALVLKLLVLRHLYKEELNTNITSELP